jgi:response regulator of citrate/malate metabolism
VRQAVKQGVVSYLIKPFTSAGFRTKLEQYVRCGGHMAASDTLRQSDVDAMLATLRPTLSTADLPKGQTMTPLTRVSAVLRDAERDVSLGASRIDRRLHVTARRYLEHLADSGLLERDTRFGARDARRWKTPGANRAYHDPPVVNGLVVGVNPRRMEARHALNCASLPASEDRAAGGNLDGVR